MQRINILVIVPLKFFECLTTDSTNLREFINLIHTCQHQILLNLKCVTFISFNLSFFRHLRLHLQPLFQYFLPETVHLGFANHA